MLNTFFGTTWENLPYPIETRVFSIEHGHECLVGLTAMQIENMKLGYSWEQAYIYIYFKNKKEMVRLYNLGGHRTGIERNSIGISDALAAKMGLKIGDVVSVRPLLN